MIEVFKTAAAVQQLCLDAGWKFCFIGGVALQRWGEPRFTNDVDVTLYTGFGDEQKYIERLMQRYGSRMDDAADFALKNRVLLLKSDSGVGIDVAFGGFPFEETMTARATYFAYPPEIKLLTCSAEDLVIMKCFADRPKDWGDVDTVISRQGAQLDWNHIFRLLPQLAALKESPDIIERLKILRKHHETET